jgi:hypothetical protein
MNCVILMGHEEEEVEMRPPPQELSGEKEQVRDSLQYPHPSSSGSVTH